MSSQYLDDLIGTQVGDYTIEELVGEGTFSIVFRATDKLGQRVKAIKIPRTFTKENYQDENIVPTQVFIKRQDRYSPQEASPIHIQKIQVARTRSIIDKRLVSVEDYSFDDDGKSYVSMPLIQGETFRKYLKSGPIPLTVFLDISETLDRFSQNENFGYHGDVKPDNMIVTDDGVMIVDCGYFGSIEPESSPENEQKTLIVTTPRYYPHLIADDLLAFGLILWEAACRMPLLQKVSYSKDHELDNVSEDLLAQVYEEEALGNFHFSQIVKAKRPSDLRPGIPKELEEFLLKAVRLKFIDQKLDSEEGFESFEEISDALKQLKNSGIHYV